MNNIWLVGAGKMAQDYAKVLKGLDKGFVVIGRGVSSANEFEKLTDIKVIQGGIESFLKTNPTIPSHVIVSVGVEKLYETTLLLLKMGVKNILVEKPGAIYKKEFENLISNKDINVFIAYNRRFYASVLKAQELIDKDGGVTSFNFEFTEWSHKISVHDKEEIVKQHWFLANSTHVVDLAFFLGGKPKELCSFASGELEWHKSGSNFSGAGVSEANALFNYQANWKSAGRWSVEILTNKNKYIFRPMEKLQIQKRGTISQEFDETIDYCLDENYKPGLYLQTKNFLEGKYDGLCSIEEQYNMIDIYNKIANYDEK